MNKEILDKIYKKRKTIVTDFDLSGFGYYRTGKYKKNRRWTLKTYRDELNKNYQKRNPEKTLVDSKNTISIKIMMLLI